MKKMPTRQELLNTCKELKLKGFTGKSKDELLKLLEIKIPEVETQIKTPINEVMIELCNLIKKDVRRKVCSNCNDLGHDKTSNKCKLNIELDNKNREKIKQYILSNEDCNDYKLADELGIGMSKYKTLYSSIPLCDLLKKQEIKEDYFEKVLDNSKYNCSLCNSIQYNSNSSSRDWKDYKQICDICWSNYDQEREQIWEQILYYNKQCNCVICGIEKKNKGQRFHYDHINMFDKGNSLCSMVIEGKPINEIYVELDKCQILCLSCHHIVTDIENNLGFTRIKQILTRKLTNCEITEEEYTQQKKDMGKIYVEKMYQIYDELHLLHN